MTTATVTAWAPRPEARPALAGESSSVLRDVLAFAIPALLFVEFHAVGRLFLSEMALLVLLPWLMTTGSLRYLPRWLLVLGCLWLLGQVLSDTVRLSPFADYSRGWSKIAFTLTNMAAVLLLLGDSSRRVILFGLGLAAGFALQFAVHPTPIAEALPWKFGFGWPVTVVAVLFVATGWRGRWPWLAPLLLAALSAIHLNLGYRSLAGACFLAAVLLFIQARWRGRKPAVHSLPVRRIILIGAAALLAMALFLQMYSLAARSGMLGEDARRLYESQGGSAWSVLIGGRSEALVSSQAIVDAPLIGHGSWAKDYRYVDLLRDRLAEHGYGTPVASIEEEPGLIPTHSYLLGAWVEAGVLGGLFWLAVLVLPLAVLATFPSARIPLAPLAALVVFALTWDVLFSPYSAVARLTAPYYVAVLLFVLRSVREPDPGASSEAPEAGIP